MIKLQRFTRIRFHDCQGIKREIRGLSLANRRRFIELFELVLEIRSEYPPETDWRSLYDDFDGNTDFQETIDEILSLFGLSPEWISASMVNSFLFQDGEEQGLFWRLEFPPARSRGGKPLPDEADPHAYALARLWSHMPEATLQQVSEAAESMPWVELEPILDAREEMFEEAHPELKKQRQKERERQELMEGFVEDLKNGELTEQPLPVKGSLKRVMGRG